MADGILDRLRSTRGDYTKELRWVRFLLDAYGGTGGFAGRVEPPAISTLGWVADAYGIGAEGDIDSDSVFSDNASYLDQYPREDSKKYAKRVEISHYENYVATIYDLLLSYALKAPSKPENLPQELEEWRENVTISGVSWWALMVHIIARRAGLMGWCPVLIDQQTRPDGEEISEAQAREAGIRIEPYVMPLTPANVLDWYINPQTGMMEWVKLRLDYKRQPDPLQDATIVEIYKIYTKTEVATWEVTGEVCEKKGKVSHPFGVVPIVSFQQKPNIEEPMRGVSMVGDASIAARRTFNLGSELDEHIRSNVFALLQVPVPDGQDPPDEVVGGSGNAVPVPASSQRDYLYVAPPASVAETLETRIANSVRGQYRRGRVQFEGATRQQSGIAKAWDFEETNRLLSDFVQQLARSEADVYTIVGVALGLTDDELAQIRVIPQSDFAVEDLITELEAAAQALQLGLGATADMKIKGRTVDRVLPDLSAADREEIGGELEQERDDTLNSSAEDDEINAPEPEPEPEPEPDPEPEE